MLNIVGTVDPPGRYQRSQMIQRGKNPGRLSGYVVLSWHTKRGASYCYAVLRWDCGRSRRTLGAVDPFSPAPILDVAIRAAPGLDLDGLAHLVVADKSMRLLVE